LVERIVDKRRNRKGKVEYLVRWRGYGSEGDTWEPETHLSTCMVYVHEFNRQHAERHQDAAFLRSTRSLPASQLSPAHQLAFRPAPAAARSDISTGWRCWRNRPRPPQSSWDRGRRGPAWGPDPDPATTRTRTRCPRGLCPGQVVSVRSNGLFLGQMVSVSVRWSLSWSGGLCSAPGLGLMVPVLLSGSSLLEAFSANGTPAAQSAVTGATGASGKRRLEERSAFDKRLRFSVRQTESAYRYRDIVVKKQDGFTHILGILFWSVAMVTSDDILYSCVKVMKEIQSAMATAASDDSKLVLFGAVGSVFCCGLDFLYFIRRLTDDRKKESIKMAETIRTFVNTFIQFRKPIVAAVNGPALGLGAALLPLCDVVWANEKAWFQTPYTAYGQTPDACASFTFPRIMGLASANELLLSGRKLTAQEACSKGLVSQVLWPGTFTQEVMLRIKELVAVDSLVLQESKALMRNTSRSALEQANERECEALKRIWGSSQGTDSILQYLQRRTELC
uniref:Chromodomain protein, Y-like n=1 Tax=Sphaeramia orbicularis TaxID=375764 RepID=A0A673AQR5_9TELE